MTTTLTLDAQLAPPRVRAQAGHRPELARAIAGVLGAQPWCSGLDREGLLHLVEVAELVERAPGETVLDEGASSNALYVVLSGEVEVWKRDRAGVERALARLERGAVFGEMSFLDGLAASATVRAASAGVRVVRLRRDRIAREPALRGVIDQLAGALALEVVRRLRALDSSYAETVRAQADEARQRSELGKLFIVTVALFGIGQITQRLITPAISPAEHMAYSWGFLLLIVGLIAAFIHVQHAPLAAFGLTTKGLVRSVFEGLAAGGAVLAAFTAWRLSSAPGEPLLSWGSVAGYSANEAALFYALYLPHCFLQELVARGVLQGSLERFLSRRSMAVLVTSALFGVFHLHVSVSFALTTFAASLAFGLLYTRHHNLAGVTVLHFLLGLGAVAFGLN